MEAPAMQIIIQFDRFSVGCDEHKEAEHFRPQVKYLPLQRERYGQNAIHLTRRK